MTRMDVTILDHDTAEDIARKLSEALNWVHELRGPVMVWYRGDQYVMIVTPDAGLAWERTQESARLSAIATQAAGIAPSGMPQPRMPGTRIERR